MAAARLKKPLFTGLIVLFLGVLAWGFSLQTNPVHTSLWNYLFNVGYALLYLSGGISGIWAAAYLTHRLAIGRALLWLGTALVSYAAGLLIWAYYNLIAHIAVPYPSGADVFFALVYVFLAVGTWHFLSMVATHIRVTHLFEVMAIFFVSSVIIIGFLNTPDTTAHIPILARIFNIWYPLGDSLLIAVSYLIFRASRDRLQSGMVLLILGLWVQVFADSIFSYRTGANLYFNGDVSDILFALSGFILTLGILTVFFDFTSGTPGTVPARK